MQTLSYEDIILRILSEAGQRGLPVKLIALNVFNVTNTFFSPVEQEEVYTKVAAYLRAESKKRNSLVSKMETRGRYCLNYSSTTVQQLLLDFSADEEDL